MEKMKVKILKNVRSKEMIKIRKRTERKNTRRE